MLSRYKMFWAILFGPLIYLFKYKPIPSKAEASLSPQKRAENEPAGLEKKSGSSKSDNVDKIVTRSSITDRKLSARLLSVSSSNTPKARAVKRRIKRSTLSRPAPVMRTKKQNKKRSIGPITWPAYKGRTAISSQRFAINPKRSSSAQILHLNIKTTTCRRRGSISKTIVRGLARAA